MSGVRVRGVGRDRVVIVVGPRIAADAYRQGRAGWDIVIRAYARAEFESRTGRPWVPLPREAGPEAAGAAFAAAFGGAS